VEFRRLRQVAKSVAAAGSRNPNVTVSDDGVSAAPAMYMSFGAGTGQSKPKVSFRRSSTVSRPPGRGSDTVTDEPLTVTAVMSDCPITIRVLDARSVVVVTAATMTVKLHARCIGLTRHNHAALQQTISWAHNGCTSGSVRSATASPVKLSMTQEAWMANTKRTDVTLSRGSLHVVRRFHLCSGEKHADSDRALPTGVCLLSISPPPGERS
jgi:hypothetical protein